MGVSGNCKGRNCAFGKDFLKMMEMLVDVEALFFKGLNVKVLFLQNVVTDLALGYDIRSLPALL